MKRNLVGKILGKIKIFVQDFVPIRTALRALTKLKIHRFKTWAVFAIAPSTCPTFYLHRVAAALLVSMASWRALTSGMKSRLSRRKISRSALPGEIELRRLPIRKERAEKFISAWQLVDSIPLYSRAMSAKYGRPALTSPVSAQVLGLLLRSQNWRSEKTFSSRWGSSAKYIRISFSIFADRLTAGTGDGELLALDASDLARRLSRLSSKSDQTFCFLGSGGMDPSPPPAPLAPPSPPAPPLPPSPAAEEAGSTKVLATFFTSSMTEVFRCTLLLTGCSAEQSLRRGSRSAQIRSTGTTLAKGRPRPSVLSRCRHCCRRFGLVCGCCGPPRWRSPWSPSCWTLSGRCGCQRPLEFI